MSTPAVLKVSLLIGLTMFISVGFTLPVGSEPIASASRLTWSSALIGVRAATIQQTIDSGFIVAGDQGISGWAVKTNAAGKTMWNNYYSPEGHVFAGVGASQTTDGGYILFGAALAINHTSTSETRLDAWLLKLSRKGTVEWSKTYLDGSFETATQTVDGGYIAVGNTNLIRCCSSGWVVKTDTAGNIVWQETFVGEDIHHISATRDGGFLVSGAVETAENVALWLLKLDAAGNIVWQHAYALPEGRNSPIFVANTWTEQTHDDGYIVSAHMGQAGLFDSPQPRQAMFFRLNASGELLWQKAYGDGIGRIDPNSIAETRDGGFIAAGSSTLSYFDGAFHGNKGPWLLKLDASGNIVWQKTYSVTSDYYGNSYFSQAQETRDGGFAVAGFLSILGSAWFLKTDEHGNVPGCSIGTSANMTLVNGDAIATETNITGVTTNATVLPTGVTVGAVTFSLEAQCIILNDARAKSCEEKCLDRLQDDLGLE